MEKIHFIHPEYLWGLLFLIIPLLIHLFNFKKAKKIFFTRVSLLKEIKTENKNFSKLKKRLILFTRLMIVLFFFIAAATPYISEFNLNKKYSKATFLYLDNSFSMQAKRGYTTLLDMAKKDLKNVFPYLEANSKIILATNDYHINIENTNKLSLELSKIDYTNTPFSLLKAKSFFFKIANNLGVSDYKAIVFSDFRESLSSKDSVFSNINILKKSYSRSDEDNISIDSIWFDNIAISQNKITLKYKLINYGENKLEYIENITFNDKIQQSLSKIISPKSDTIFSVNLHLPDSKRASGFIAIEDNKSIFDNKMYFSMDFTNPAKVLFVGLNTDDRLKKILNDDFVNLDFTSNNNFAHLELSKYDFIIYTVKKNTPSRDINLLKKYLSKGNNIMIYPSESISLESFDEFFYKMDLPRVKAYIPVDSYVSNISYSNVFFDDIFRSKVENYTYPIIKSKFILAKSNITKLLSFDDNSMFFGVKDLENSKIYMFLSPIFSGQDAFIYNDLSIPLLYKISTEKLSRNLYFNIKHDNNVSVKLNKSNNIGIKIGEDVLPMKRNNDNTFLIPTPPVDGIYNIYSDDTIIKTIAFNNDRKENNYIKESEYNYISLDNIEGENEVIYYWRLLIILAILFLSIETMLLYISK